MMQTEEQVKTTTVGGRKRKHLVKFFLNDEEYEKLCRDAATCNKDLSKYIRMTIQWIAPIESPSVEVKEFTRELRRLGVSMNQTARKSIAIMVTGPRVDVRSPSRSFSGTTAHVLTRS